MSQRLPPLFHALLLASIAMRIVFGAPCCLPGSMQQDKHHTGAEMAEHSAPMHRDMAAGMQQGEASGSGHDSHGEDAGRSNPCCSACGPVLAGAPPKVLAAAKVFETYAISVLQRMPARDLIRQYEATGPPIRI